MPSSRQQLESTSPSIEFHFLGRVEFEDCVALQERLVYEASGRSDGRIDVLFCEHPNLITVGRKGSRAHIRLSNEELVHRQLNVRWVSRGGGCVLHAPGQLAVYPIVPLSWHGWSVGDYQRRIQRAVVSSLDQMNVRSEIQPTGFGVWGRSGQIAAVGVAVRNWITCHGFFVNVNPSMTSFGFIDVSPPELLPAGCKTTMGCLLAERQRPVRMTEVRAALVSSLATAFDCQRYHLHTGHALLAELREPKRESLAHYG